MKSKPKKPSKVSPKENEMICRATAKSRYGLTDTMLKRLGKPDKEVPNPHYKTGPYKAGLYKVSRIERFAKRNADAIEQEKRKRPARQEAARKAVETKVTKLMEQINEIGLEWRQLPETFAGLYQQTWSHVFSRYRNSTDPGPNGVMATVRHEFTNYEVILSKAAGRVGKVRVYEDLRDTLDCEIEHRLWSAYRDDPDFIKLFC